MAGSIPPAPTRRAVFVRDATGLIKQISPFDAFGMAITQMGLLYVFNVVAFTPASYPTANPLPGPFVGLLLILPIAGMYIMMSIAIPRSGGDYVWMSRVLHPSVGFITNFSLTLIVLSVVGAVAPWIGQWSLGEMFYDLGLLQNNQNYINIATSLQEPNPTFWVSAVFIIIAGLVVMASSKLAGRVVKSWTVISLVIGAVFVAVVLSAGVSTFQHNFDLLTGTNQTYDSVIAAGQVNGAYPGVPPVFSFSTLYAAALGLLGYLGFNSSAYFAGEIKQNRRGQIIAQLGGTVLFAVFTTIMIAVEYFGEGPSFVNAMANLWATGSSSYPYLTIPLASGLSMFWTQNPILVSTFNLAFGLTAEVMNISIFFTLSRNLFAWSFDRVAPSAFAGVNSRTNTPLYAIALMTIGGIAYSYIAIFYSGIISTLFTYGTVGEFIVFAIVAITAIAYPYRRKDVFDSSDPTAKRRIGGVPLITIFGILSFIVSLITIYALLLNALGGAIGSILAEGVLPTFIIGVIIYVIVWAVRRSQGINLGLIQTEIPPE